ncbi:penicillin-binding protein 1C [Variovorax sp. RHLX14]|uniref:penicillin-binding protein 1C n=1 Tax=Variovorax sp. RHLX14 TaxID=1259731 RepID=UPI003F46D6F8
MPALRFTLRTQVSACVVALALGATAQTVRAMSTFEETRATFHPSDTAVLDRDGALLQRLRTDATVRRGQWIALPDISPALRTAMLLSEDRRFYEHSGVDWRAVSSAAWGNLWNTRTRGASTLTMQLAGLLDDDLRGGVDNRGGGRSVTQKLGQTVAATQLESRWRKDQILEAYLNLVPFRGEIVGIDALSRTLFGKAAHGLDSREAAVAAALVRAPNASPARVGKRACEMLREMAQSRSQTDKERRSVDCAAIEMFASAALQRRAFDASEGIAPHVARRAWQAQQAVVGKGEARSQFGEIRTTLRASLQRFALATLQRHLRELRGRNVQDAGLVVLDNASGDVLAWIGSSGELSRAADVDAVTALRQPGSTLKPLLYAQAIAERRLTAASLIDDSSAQISTASGLYIPQNYDRQFKGMVSARTALAASLNVPAVRTLVMVSPESFARQLRAIGLPLKEGGGYYGYSLALGSAEVSLLGLTNAYRMLANGGMYSGTRVLADGAPGAAPSRAVDAGAAFIVGDILSDANARTRTFGVDSVLGTRFWTAVKTGTSKDMRDNWAVGWSQRYTVGVWVGNAGGAPMWDVSGTTGAAPVWAEVMGFLHAKERSVAPKPPAGLVKASVRFGNELEAARDEWFIAGTEQALFAQGASPDDGPRDSRSARIVSPTDGSIIALDPDIPPMNQRMRFQADGYGPGLLWRISGKTIARGERASWLPWPGRHVVELVDARGRVLDMVKVEVRGAGVTTR